MPETTNSITVGLSKETEDHAHVLERLARADELEFYLLSHHLVDLQPTISDLHTAKSNVDPEGVT